MSCWAVAWRVMKVHGEVDDRGASCRHLRGGRQRSNEEVSTGCDTKMFWNSVRETRGGMAKST